jgi:hypothetical protein
MTAIIKRSFLVAMGQTPPPDLAYVISDHRGRRVVTWAEVLQDRRERQREQLRRKREGWGPGPERAYKLWVAYFDQNLMGGWHAFLETYRPGLSQRTWINRDCRWLIPVLMQLFPLVLPLGSERDQWALWMPAFAQQHKRRMQDRHPVGVAPVWWNGRDVLRRAI